MQHFRCWIKLGIKMKIKMLKLCNYCYNSRTTENEKVIKLFCNTKLLWSPNRIRGWWASLPKWIFKFCLCTLELFFHFFVSFLVSNNDVHNVNEIIAFHILSYVPIGIPMNEWCNWKYNWMPHLIERSILHISIKYCKNKCFILYIRHSIWSSLSIPIAGL